MVPWTNEEIDDLLLQAPKTNASSLSLNKDEVLAHDVALSTTDRSELYRLISTTFLEHIGYILFVRVPIETSPRYGRDDLQVGTRYYVRLQFVKPEDMRTL